MKVIDTREYVSVLKQLTDDGREVSMRIAGNSMAPFLSHERDTIFFRKPEAKLKKGDMVFFKRRNGQYIMHRIHHVKPDGYYIVGDAQCMIEGPVAGEQIFAVVTKVIRKGKTIQPGDFWWEFFRHVWLHMIPLRRPVMALYTKLLFRGGRS
jgi:signal peptidase